VRRSDNIESANMRMAARRTVNWSTWPGIRSAPSRTKRPKRQFVSSLTASPNRRYCPISQRSNRRASSSPGLFAAGKVARVCQEEHDHWRAAISSASRYSERPATEAGLY
jgi:hypothetical protein